MLGFFSVDNEIACYIYCSPNLRDRLAAKLAEYLLSVEAQMPFIKATGDAIPYPGSQSHQ
ncbi:hypothetical protein [uncultured Rubinisphaera sp.]|uniref:hypothetical protein n=1 Tax=uncultured Rubinisphaera sp. TaxID=1678686 RepID=UPI0030D743E1